MAIDRAEVFFQDRASLRLWLSQNQAQTQGVWALHYKKTTGLSDLSWEAIVEECLCFGWIDSVPGKVDELKTKIYISPRKPTSGWSSRNKQLVLDLIARGIMTEHGLSAIELAKANGSWNRFDLSEALVPPKKWKQFSNVLRSSQSSGKSCLHHVSGSSSN